MTMTTTARTNNAASNPVLGNTPGEVLDGGLLDQLERVAGIRPSLYWLNACRAHLLQQPNQQQHQQHQQASNQITPDALLYYILQSDLRDVVRDSHDNHQDQDHDNAGVASRDLRYAVERSLLQPPFHQTLPSSFAMMMQVEELLDVSKNAQARLELGPVAPHEPTPIGNQRNRCLKLYLSDGFYEQGRRRQRRGPPTQTVLNTNEHDSTSAADIHVVAMEVLPIPHLSVHSKAGIKILLKGPVEVRHGLIVCHPGNTTVLGGQVPHLVQIQQAALLQAQRVAGIGVDATVRALIGNNPTLNHRDENDDDEEQDVGEQESRDVATIPPTPTVSTARAHSQLVPTTTNRIPTRAVANVPATSFVASQVSSYRALQPQLNLPSCTDGARQPPSAAAMPPPPPGPIPTSNLPRKNPYMAPPPAAAAVARMDGVTATSQASRPNYSPETFDSLNIHDHSRHQFATTAGASQQSTSDSNRPGATHSPSNAVGGEQLLTMTEIIHLLRRCCHDRAFYDEQVGKIWIVPMQHYAHVDFNIEKRKHITKEERKQGHKYDYVMTAKFGGPSADDGLITCNVSNHILEPYFGYSAAEMRKMRREDRNQAQTIVAERGRAVATELKALHKWQVTLCKSTDDFFRAPLSPPSCLDGKDPILLILKQQHEG